MTKIAVAILFMLLAMASGSLAKGNPNRGEQFISTNPDPDAVAGVWTVNSDLVIIRITRINGKRLRPALSSFSLAPGTYTLDAELALERGQNPFLTSSARISDFRFTVEAGHTYGLNHRYSEDRRAVGLVLEDLGTRQSCEYIDLPTSGSKFLDCTTRPD
ncbi:hypothetical protein [Pseudoxanthomonas sp. Root630]|uniref:hypothetical protein n=1 Tax=Pseudoxanthomonas sp. Root630 TaxID=1736574 RepID=UPI000703B8A3|nr:hypothetical protein [Pseudoxanthomonas sp. Root630]KRA45134.1 hypothetical protein ASD72_07665 [Pseudoxanthomonas sp. Root630]